MDEELMTAITIANTDAQARYYAAQVTATAAANAETTVATTRAAADEAVANTQLSASVQVAQIDASWRDSVATIEANAQVQAASIQATAQEQVASTESSWHQQVAQTEAAAQEQVATTQASAQTTVATTQATASVNVATIDASWRGSVAQIEATAQTTVASTQATASVNVATIESNWHASVAQIEATATVEAATIGASYQVEVANIDASWHAGVATIEANAQTAVATTNAQAQVQSATLQSNASIQVATINSSYEVEVANIDASWHQGVANTEANAQIQSATIEASWHQGVANTELTGTEYAADQQLAGVNAHETAETYRLNLKLAFATDKWNTLLPIIDSALGIVAGNAGAGLLTLGSGGIGFGASAKPGPVMGFGAIIAGSNIENPAADEWSVGSYSRRITNEPMRMGGGDVKTGGIGFGSGSSVADAVAATQLPYITTRGVLTPAQIQQQVNAAYARNDAKTNSAALQIVEDLSGQGFSANSPIISALKVGLTGQNLRSSVMAEQQIRLEGAKANADMVFQTQKAVSDQFIAQEGVLIDNARNDVTRTVGILSAVSQLIGSAL